MAQLSIVIFYFIFFTSMICALCTAIKLYLQGKNYLIAVLAIAMALGELVVLPSIIWIEDFRNTVPRNFCIVQALALQYAVYLQIVAALCFAFHIYQLLVHFKQGISQKLQKFYISVLIIVPITITIIAAVVSIKVDAIGPLALNCDIKKPIWVRLIGYSGFNLMLTFPGVYFSSRAAYQVLRHLDQFKSKISHGAGADSNDSTRAMTENRTNASHEIEIHVDSNHEITNSEPTTTPETRTTITAYRRPKSQSRANQIKAYNMTKAAAIRMVLFACGFALINVAASFQTVRLILQEGLFGVDNHKGIGGNDFAGGLNGLMLFLVFGLPRNVKRCFTHKK